MKASLQSKMIRLLQICSSISTREVILWAKWHRKDKFYLFITSCRVLISKDEQMWMKLIRIRCSSDWWAARAFTCVHMCVLFFPNFFRSWYPILSRRDRRFAHFHASRWFSSQKMSRSAWSSFQFHARALKVFLQIPHLKRWADLHEAHPNSMSASSSRHVYTCLLELHKCLWSF